MEPSTEPAQELASNGLLSPPRQCRTVLVIEDDGFVRRAACEVLTDFGYIPLGAANGALVRAAFARKQGRIDVVVCDAVLPDATELCNFFLREQPQLRVVLTSGYPISTSAPDMSRNTCYLEKPYSGDSLITILNRAFAEELHAGGTLMPGMMVADDMQNLSG